MREAAVNLKLYVCRRRNIHVRYKKCIYGRTRLTLFYEPCSGCIAPLTIDICTRL